MKLTKVAACCALWVAGVWSAPNAIPGSDIQTEHERPPEGKSWEEWHMEHEHQMKEYDAETFFDLHDLNKKGYFDSNDILSMYGLARSEVVGAGDGMGSHDNSEAVDKSLGDRVVKFIMDFLDVDSNNRITKQEFLEYAKGGKKFPDLGVGVGHHSDFEEEYEIHHWNKFHKDSDSDVKNVHKEDVEHELLHHEHEIEHEEAESMGATQGTVLTDDVLESRIAHERIPNKYFAGIR
ncbi:HCL115Cp [Eremothecium sinecaudum]|uniref:HCL115Cp n=1 Tax=Eremothecium sinecaudum TaxID=45286 RepID=A0A0X8HQC8_9SACH|nr:HCL115Cp [Eremothecium sinecaudum]AMD20036.1 HCL115Cp [Eremothecium sinecaudum]